MSKRRIESRWRSVLLFALTCYSVFLLLACSAADKAIDQNTNYSVQVNSEVPSGGRLIEIDPYETVDELTKKDIKEISPKLGIVPLPEAAQPDEFELRIWTGFSLGNDKLLIIRSDRSKNNAYFFDINRRVEPIRSNRQVLASPKSGWNTMLLEARNRLTTPNGLVRDPQFDLSRDEPMIMLEALEKGEYRRVFYGQNTSFPDGKRLISVCDYLASEFDLDMNCRGID